MAASLTQVVLGDIRRLAMDEPTKQHSSMVSASGSCLRILSLLPSVNSYDVQVKTNQILFFPRLLLVTVMSQHHLLSCSSTDITISP